MWDKAEEFLNLFKTRFPKATVEITDHSFEYLSGNPALYFQCRFDGIEDKLWGQYDMISKTILFQLFNPFDTSK